MKGLSILLLWCFCAFGQSAPIPPAEQKVPDQEFGLAVGTNGHPVGNIEILSDTQGVDFGPYLNRILPTIRQNWFRLIPDSAKFKKGKLAIEFAITKDGKVPDMRLVASSGMLTLIVRHGAALLRRIRFRRSPAILPDLISPCASASITTPIRAISLQIAPHQVWWSKHLRHPPICKFRLEGQ